MKQPTQAPALLDALQPQALPAWCADAVKQADALALAARKAALAGDHQRADELRAEFDRVWDGIEAQLEQAQPVPAEAVFLGR